MLTFPLSFLLGDLFLQSQSILPAKPVIILAGLIGLFILLSKHRLKLYLIIISGLLLGFAWTGWQASVALNWQLPHALEGKPLVIRGIIASLPISNEFGTHFIFAVRTLKNNGTQLNGRAYIRLSWSEAKYPQVGDQYEFNVRLKRIHGLRNPGGFDYEAWALENGLRASGAVIANTPVKFLGHKTFYAPANQIRQLLERRIVAHLPSSETAPWLLALMIGERSAAPAKHWQVLRATGTNHLMAIAGLHIGLISGLIHSLIQFLWRRSAWLTALYPAPLAAAVAALLTAWAYSALAGFSIPTQRACIMITFFICAHLARRQLPAWHAWSAALVVVLLLNPLSVLSESFWLSFGTIALIIYGMNGRLAPSGFWWKWGRVQWVIGLGLLPLSLLFFQETSLVSVAANSIAIPWLGFLILPFCLLSSIFLLVWPPLGGVFLWIADKSLAGLWVMLQWFAHLGYATWIHAIPSNWVLISTITAVLILLLPAGTPGRWLGLFWLMPVYFYQPSVPAINDYWVTTLDIGQGLSVIVQTNHHTLIFDTGPRFGDQFDMGESVVLPYLHAAGVKHIDKMIISHGDNDHIGGAEAILRSISVDAVLTSAVEKFKAGRAELCLAGMNWRWDGINFAIIYPYRESLTLGNDSSCVLRIDNGRHSVLLTGDIEKFAEKQLLMRPNVNLHANLLTAPHHGSKTSSQTKFIQAVAPNYVIFATGYRNRYHFPHSSVVKQYGDEKVMMLNTVDAGAIQFRLEQQNTWLKPMPYRINNNRYWSD